LADINLSTISKGVQSPVSNSLNNSMISKNFIRDKFSPGPEKRESLASSVYSREPLMGTNSLNLSANTSQLASPSNQSFNLTQTPGSKFFPTPNNQADKTLQMARSVSPEIKDQTRNQKENVFSKFENMKKKNDLKLSQSLNNTSIKGKLEYHNLYLFRHFADRD
jgi:hypothetical protein